MTGGAHRLRFEGRDRILIVPESGGERLGHDRKHLTVKEQKPMKPFI